MQNKYVDDFLSICNKYFMIFWYYMIAIDYEKLWAIIVFASAYNIQKYYFEICSSKI